MIDGISGFIGILSINTFASISVLFIMSDAGSMFVGLSVIWLLTMVTQGGQFLLGQLRGYEYVLYRSKDMLSIVTRHYKKGKSPFKLTKSNCTIYCNAWGLAHNKHLRLFQLLP